MSGELDNLPSALSRVAFFEQRAQDQQESKTRSATFSVASKPATAVNNNASSNSSRSASSASSATGSETAATTANTSGTANTAASMTSRPRFSTVVAWRRGVASSTSPTATASTPSPTPVQSHPASSAATASKQQQQQQQQQQPQQEQSAPVAMSSAAPSTTTDTSGGRPNPMSIQDRLAAFGGSRERSAPVASGPRRAASFSTVTPQARRSQAAATSAASTAKPSSSAATSSLSTAATAATAKTATPPTTTTATTTATTATTATNAAPVKRAGFSTIPAAKTATSGNNSATSAAKAATSAASSSQSTSTSKPVPADISHLMPKGPVATYTNITKVAGPGGSRRGTAPAATLRKAKAGGGGGGGGNSNRCAVCDKPVYAMEKVQADGIVVHKWCFRCAECNCKVSVGSYASLDGVIYCKPHFKQLFQLRGRYTFNEEEAPDVNV